MKSKKLIVLAGINHSGKTTLGRELARQLGCDFFDTDLETERLTGKHPALHTKEGGQSAYNREETRTAQVLVDGITDSEKYTVISTGGGFCDNPDGWRFLKEHGYILWLNAPLEVSADRVIYDAQRVLDDGGSFVDFPRYPGYQDAPLQSMEDVRAMFYEFITPQLERYRNLCDIEVPVSDSTVAENVAVLRGLLP